MESKEYKVVELWEDEINSGDYKNWIFISDTNLQPMLKEDNIKKRNHLDWGG